MQQDPMRPAITLGQSEHRKLRILAMIAAGHTADDSDFLNHELDRAALVPDAHVPDDVVTVGSRVTYATEDGRRHRVTLAYPEQADPAAGRVSVTSPVGAALLGLRPGQSITRMGWDGAFTRFAVLSVIPPRSLQ